MVWVIQKLVVGATLVAELTVDEPSAMVTLRDGGKGMSKRHDREKPKRYIGSHSISEPGFDPGTCGLWAHHASAAPL
ncbi:hypothetical protein Q3G72_014794 [Acer saccharum]|nr:hypothetical protein Q3G72_014794 [Acer saccharum]